MEDKQTEIRLMYRELANTLRTKYNPHFNLYQVMHKLHVETTIGWKNQMLLGQSIETRFVLQMHTGIGWEDGSQFIKFAEEVLSDWSNAHQIFQLNDKEC